MIIIDKVDVCGWESALRGMRNPMNSWDRMDTDYYKLAAAKFSSVFLFEKDMLSPLNDAFQRNFCTQCLPSDDLQNNFIGKNDHDLMMRLRKAGTDHRKFMRMITVYADILAPLYWWKEYDTYKVGTVANSCSTMHKIQAKEFTVDDFSHEHLTPSSCSILENICVSLNYFRKLYLEYNDKNFWWQMIQLLPTSYNQKRTVMLNYEVLANIYKSRKYHKLDEWRTFCSWIETLPYSELITEDWAEEE